MCAFRIAYWFKIEISVVFAFACESQIRGKSLENPKENRTILGKSMENLIGISDGRNLSRHLSTTFGLNRFGFRFPVGFWAFLNG